MRKTTLTLLMILISSSVIFYSCYPGEDLTYEDTDVVITFYDDQTDFAALGTYAVLDSVIHISDSTKPSDDISRIYDQQILDLIDDNMKALGYTEAADQNSADVHLAALATTTTWVSGGCYYGYWSYSYPYYGWCYPTYSTYSTGTVLIVMADPKKGGDDKGVWIATMNGVLSGSTSDTSNRLNKNINQAFSQSPYLGEGK